MGRLKVKLAQANVFCPLASGRCAKSGPQTLALAVCAALQDDWIQPTPANELPRSLSGELVGLRLRIPFRANLISSTSERSASRASPTAHTWDDHQHCPISLLMSAAVGLLRPLKMIALCLPSILLLLQDRSTLSLGT